MRAKMRQPLTLVGPDQLGTDNRDRRIVSAELNFSMA